MCKYGWQKIVGIEPLVETSEDGTVSFEAIQVLTDEGDVHTILPRHGETAEDLVNRYRKRGWTDSRC